jgi:acetoin:2,6-dichlorophenolindophenol oxidoreductase subunit beta
MSIITENCSCKITRIALPDIPVPTSWYLCNHIYADFRDILKVALNLLNIKSKAHLHFTGIDNNIPRDVPDKSFLGPF